MHNFTTSAFIADLWERYSYNPLTGKLINNKTNKIVVGTSSIDNRNYRRLTVNVRVNGTSRHVAYARAVYAWLHGEWPKPGFHVDHINHNSHDNRLCNLRCITARQNNQNRRNQKSPGVYWNKRLSKWQAQIRIQDKRIYLGLYISEFDALKKYIQTCEQNGFEVLPSVKNRLKTLAATP
jgi:hypothetical protein